MSMNLDIYRPLSSVLKPDVIGVEMIHIDDIDILDDEDLAGEPL